MAESDNYGGPRRDNGEKDVRLNQIPYFDEKPLPAVSAAKLRGIVARANKAIREQQERSLTFKVDPNNIIRNGLLQKR